MLRPECLGKERGHLVGWAWPEQAAEEKQSLLKVAGNSQFRICLWFFHTGPNCFKQSLLLLLKCDVALTAVIMFYILDTLYFNVYPPNTQIIHTVLTMVINSLVLNCQKKWVLCVSRHSGFGCNWSEQGFWFWKMLCCLSAGIHFVQQCHLTWGRRRAIVLTELRIRIILDHFLLLMHQTQVANNEKKATFPKVFPLPLFQFSFKIRDFL